MASAEGQEGAGDLPGAERIAPYAWIALAILTLANFVSYVDRQILSILAQSIKADLKLDDAQLGFLLGTAFAIFFAVVGVAMGRIADTLSRKWTMTCGMTIWSAMTALGGAASGFAYLGAARVGVGVGEAAANPCSYSLLSDYFPARNRAAVLGVYVAGTFLGSAFALVIGGLILQHWSPGLCGMVPVDGACALAPWRAALLIVGLPGIPLAFLIATLREPPSAHRPKRRVLPVLVREFGATIPPFTLFALAQASGRRAVGLNLLAVALLAAAAAVLIHLTGDAAQWCAFAIGGYAIVTWGQVQHARDYVLFRLTFGCPAFALGLMSSALIACINGAVQAWSAPYALRTFALSPAQVGLAIGLTQASASAIGVVAGGWIADRWRARDRRAPMWIGLVSVFGGLPSMTVMLTAHDPAIYVAGLFVYCFFVAIWPGAYAAFVQELVLSRMRGTASAVSVLVTIVIASGLGPYWVGKVSAMTGSLRVGMLSMQVLLPLATLLIILTARHVRHETPDRRIARATAAGEPALYPV